MKRFIFRFPLLNVIVILGITAFLGWQIPRLTLDNDTFNFIPDDDPALVAMEDLMDQYGSNIVMALVISDPYSSILSQANISAIDQLSSLFEEIEGVESVESITTTDYISGSEGSLTVSPLSKNNEGEILPPGQIQKRINSWKLYSKMLLSEDKHSTQIGITIAILSL